ncbi:MAG: ATP-binding cassette domain-containing protein [Bacteroidales bacterium]|nr:ATP-binding cassette domain-containing protein [Bacteroidales bacterium]
MPLDTIISFENVPIFQKDNLVLTDVSFHVDKGEFLFIIGKTGTGKSSLLKTIYAELPLVEGAASVAGYDLRTMKRKDIPFLRRKLGIIFQDFQLLNDRSVFDNLVFIMKATGWKEKRKIEERIHDVLAKVGLDTKGFKMPHQLSGGEQQRLGIARALINDPEIVLADEPTGNLDPETSRGIVELLFDISRSGRTVIMATHDYSLFEFFKARTLVCEDGKLVSSIS